METKVYEYGCSKPLTNSGLLDQHMKLEFEYYNRLVDLQNLYKRECDAALQQVSEYREVVERRRALGQQLGAIRELINVAKAAAGVNVDTPELDVQAKDVKKLLRAQYDIEATARKVAVRKQKVALKKLEAILYDERKKLYHSTELYWGSINACVASIEQAAKKAKPWRKLEYREWDGRASLTVQVQGGMSSAEIFSCEDNRLRIVPVPVGAYDTRAARRRGQRTRAFFLIRTDKKEGKRPSPVFVEMDIFLHRPIPDTAVIKSVRLLRENIAGVPRYKLQLTVITDNNTVSAEGRGKVVVDLGWCEEDTHDGSMRAGYYASEFEQGVIPLSVDLVGAIKKAAELRSTRDTETNKTQPLLSSWLKGQLIPAWLADATKFLHQWRSAERFHRLYTLWGSRRFSGDEIGYGLLDAWARHDWHLYQWEANQRDKSLRRRREEYRVLAARLANQYAELVLEDFDLRKVSRDVAPEDNKSGGSKDKKAVVAPSELRRCLEQAFLSRGRKITYVPAAYSSKTCNICKQRTELKIGVRAQTCDKCGVEFDRDENACHNLLDRASGQMVNEPQEALATAKSVKGRWQKRKELKKVYLEQKSYTDLVTPLETVAVTR